jgi:dihydroflavonol-4-reductase
MLTVVTGATGHLGANLVRALIERRRRVRVVVHRDSRSLEGLDVERVNGDVCDAASLEHAFAGAEVVYHLAAMISITGDRGGMVSRVNAFGVRNAAGAALKRGVRRFIHCSSIHAYRMAGVRGVIDETSARAEQGRAFAYDASKAAGERELRAAIERGLDAVIVNPTGVIGPNDFGPSRMGRMLLDLHRRRLPALVTGGFDWIDVRDVVTAMLAAETKGRTGESYILSGHWHSVPELARMASETTGVRPPRLTVPAWLALLGCPAAALHGRIARREPLYTRESLAAIGRTCRVARDKAMRELGHAPRPIAETIRDTYAWFDSAGMLGVPRALEAHTG